MKCCKYNLVLSYFQNLCRELWCANNTHALRAHPALEGTDCSAKPYPYGSVSQNDTQHNDTRYNDTQYDNK
jgi:hypothetical protein